jgi:hypothetical protein
VLPPLHELTRKVAVELPQYLGSMSEPNGAAEDADAGVSGERPAGTGAEALDESAAAGA